VSFTGCCNEVGCCFVNMALLNNIFNSVISNNNTFSIFRLVIGNYSTFQREFIVFFFVLLF
jgi:hypothetical protein